MCVCVCDFTKMDYKIWLKYFSNGYLTLERPTYDIYLVHEVKYLSSSYLEIILP